MALLNDTISDTIVKCLGLLRSVDNLGGHTFPSAAKRFPRVRKVVGLEVEGDRSLHRQRIYVDTSVIGGCLDSEFLLESRALVEMARRGELTLLLSDLLFQELEDAPVEVMAVVDGLPPDGYVLVGTTDEAEFLQERYLDAGILGASCQDDALHVAIATVARADLIVSWNFKHIVQVDKIRRFCAVNLVHGYQAIDIRSPKEVVSL